jgi:hypothetical protein
MITANRLVVKVVVQLVDPTEAVNRCVEAILIGASEYS